MDCGRDNTPEWLFDLYQGGELSSAGNREFSRKFIEAVVPQAERGAMLTAEGGLSQDGLRRIENAVFARAYDDPALLAELTEYRTDH